MELCDIGVNLCDTSFRTDLDAVLARGRAASVTRMIVTGSSVAGSRQASELCAEHSESLWSTAGVHPHHAKDCDEDTPKALRDLAALPKVVAIGECGLDYNRDFSPRDVQRRWFEAQVELACDLNMPLFLHERDALDDQLAILRRHRARFDNAVVHCFTGDETALRSYLDLDLHIGITGWICDERRGGHLLELLKLIPSNRLMIETDAPYLLPRTIKPKPKSRRNEPAYLSYVLRTVAECLGQPESAIAATTTATAIAFFDLPRTSA